MLLLLVRSGRLEHVLNHVGCGYGLCGKEVRVGGTKQRGGKVRGMQLGKGRSKQVKSGFWPAPQLSVSKGAASLRRASLVLARRPSPRPRPPLLGCSSPSAPQSLLLGCSCCRAARAGRVRWRGCGHASPTIHPIRCALAPAARKRRRSLSAAPHTCGDIPCCFCLHHSLSFPFFLPLFFDFGVFLTIKSEIRE